MRRILIAGLLLLLVLLAGCRVRVDPYVRLPGTILYTADVDGMRQVIMNTPQGDDPVVVTRSGMIRQASGFHEPWLSPDGRFIVCVVAVRGFRELALVELDGEPRARLLTEEGTYKADPVISPDGAYVYYVSTSFLGYDELFRLDLANPYAEPVRLTDRRSNDREPALSLDGNDLVYVSDQHGSYDLYAIDLTGERPPRRLTDADGTVSSPVFAPRNDFILYSILREGKMGIGYVRFHSGTTGRVISPDDAMVYYPAVSPCAEYVMVVGNKDGQVDVLLYTWYGEFVRRVTDDPRREFDLVWFPPVY